MVIVHVGVAVRSLEPAVEEWERLFGYRQATEVVVNTRQKVRVVFLAKPGSLPVKLVESTDPAAPLRPGLHHLAFRAGAVGAEVERLEGLGARVLSPPQPGEAFEEEAIAFVHAAGLNVEVIDTDRRARRRPEVDGLP